MSDWTPDLVKEHFEALLAQRDRALTIQASEYERRLDSLNGAHAEAQRVLGTYLPRETWEAWLKEERTRRDKRDTEVNSLRAEVDAAKAAALAVAASTAHNLAIATVVIAVVVALANHVI